jgi:hypothetical protein
MTRTEIAIDDRATDRVIVEIVETAATAVGLHVTLRTSTQSYPGSIHWHFKKMGEPRGTLELTYWPEAKRLWAKVHRGRRAKWIAGSLVELTEEVAGQLAGRKRRKSKRLAPDSSLRRESQLW